MTGNAKYADWMEKILLNGVRASMRIHDDDMMKGRTFYYGSFLSPGDKYYFPAPYPCCSGTYLLNVCEVANQIYFKDADSLYVAEFIGSEVENIYDGKRVVVTQETNFPEESDTKLTLNLNGSAAFNVKIRVPSWAKNASFKVNGESFDAPVKNGWAVISRTYSNGDVIEADFDISLELVPVDEGDLSMNFAMYGPLYMVGTDPTIPAARIAEGKSFNDYIVGKNGANIFAKDANGKLIELKPYYNVGDGERFAGNFEVKRPV